MSDLITTTVRELRPGDTVWAHGMRCVVNDEPTRSRSHPDDNGGCHYVHADVVNRDDVPDRAVPYGFTRRADGTHGWVLQGNDLFAVAREPRQHEEAAA